MGGRKLAAAPPGIPARWKAESRFLQHAWSASAPSSACCPAGCDPGALLVLLFGSGAERCSEDLVLSTGVMQPRDAPGMGSSRGPSGDGHIAAGRWSRQGEVMANCKYSMCVSWVTSAWDGVCHTGMGHRAVPCPSSPTTGSSRSISPMPRTHAALRALSPCASPLCSSLVLALGKPKPPQTTAVGSGPVCMGWHYFSSPSSVGPLARNQPLTVPRQWDCSISRQVDEALGSPKTSSILMLWIILFKVLVL